MIMMTTTTTIIIIIIIIIIIMVVHVNLHKYRNDLSTKITVMTTVQGLLEYLIVGQLARNLSAFM
jgi:hypothetical protein